VRARFAAALGASLILAPRAAGADMTKVACIDANTRGQDLRRGGELAAAREQLRACTDPSCPGLVRDDCSRRLDELEKAQPTVVFEVKDGAGNDLSDVEVTVDGDATVHSLDGTALRIDPGEHVFVFHAAGQAPVSRRLMLTEAEKERRERIIIGAPTALRAVAGPLPPPEAGTAPRRGGMSAQRILGLATGGAGVAGLALGSVFGVMTMQQVAQQRTDCASPSDCPRRSNALSDHSGATTDSTIANVAFVAGGALLATGLALYFSGARTSDEAHTSGLVLAPGIGSMALSGRF
jgi:hypothetical protein